MIRASVYLAVAGVVWCAEGFIFSRFFGFSAWQMALAALFYIGAFAVAVRYLIDGVRQAPESDGYVAAWRLVSVAPMLVVILGSFISLPVMLALLALGELF